MTIFRLGLIATACAVALAGCSSSSGGGGDVTPVYFTTKPDESETTKSTEESKAIKETVEKLRLAAEKNDKGQSETETEKSGTTVKTGTTDKTDTSTANTSGKNEDTATSSTSTSSTSTTNTSTTNTSTTNTNPFKNNVFVKNDLYRLTGGIVTVDKDGSTVNKDLSHYEKEDLNVLVVDNVHIHLGALAADDEQNGFAKLTAKAQNKGVLGSDFTGYKSKQALYSEDTRYYQYMRFGVFSVNGKDNLFVQGLQTPSKYIDGTENGYADLYPMERTGRANYVKGDALYGKDGNYETLKAKVKVNFTSKDISVSLLDPQTNAEKLAFSGKISGSNFEGNSNGVVSKGAFYGSLSAQVGGVFYKTEGEDKGKNGVFGATDKRFE